MRGFVTAIRTLTVFPIPGRDSESFASPLPWFPVVGLIIGGILYFLGKIWLAIFGAGWHGGGALFLLLASVLSTRGLHLDGLADWADSLGGNRERGTKLAIMKDVRLGAFGVLALILVLMTKWIAFERILSSGSIPWLLLIHILSRGMMVEPIATLPYARSEDGMARPFVGDARGRHRLGALTVAFLLSVIFGPLGMVAFGLAWTLTKILAVYYNRSFGGVTGDLLGTANEVIEVVLLIICALSGKFILCYTGWTWLGL